MTFVVLLTETWFSYIRQTVCIHVVFCNKLFIFFCNKSLGIGRRKLIANYRIAVNSVCNILQRDKIPTVEYYYINR